MKRYGCPVCPGGECRGSADDPVACSCTTPDPGVNGECGHCHRLVVTPQMLEDAAALRARQAVTS